MEEDKCIVKSCEYRSNNLFCSPTDKKLLKRWQEAVKTKETNFFICENHFSSKDIATEKYLEPAAVPSIDISRNEYSKDGNSCGMCLVNCEKSEISKLTKIASDNFKEITSLKPANENMCSSCAEFIEIFNHFKTDIKQRHLKLRNQQNRKIDDEEECVVLDESSSSPIPFEKSDPQVKCLKLPSEIVSKLSVVDGSIHNLVRCKHCYFKTTDKALLNDHIDETHYFPCKNCTFISSNDPLLTLHKNKFHSKDDKAIICGICDEKFEKKDEINVHYIITHDTEFGANFNCFYCKETGKTADQLRLHYKLCHKGGLSTAQDQINNTKLQLSLIKSKEKTEQSEAQSYNELVEKIGTSVTVKKISKNKVNKVKKKVTMKRDAPFDFHLPINTPIKIPKSLPELKRRKITEVTIVSSKQNSQYLKENVEDMDEAGECSHNSSEDELVAEIDDTICLDTDSDGVEEVPETSSSSTKPTKPNDTKGFKCLTCNQTFSEIAQLLDHREEEHPPDDKLKEYEEFDMSKVPEDPRNRKDERANHVRVACDICSILVSEKYLQRHKELRHTERQFLCHLCSSTHSDPTTFKYHMMKHEPSTLFQCDMCSTNGYVTKGKLERHIKRSHLRRPDVRAQCSICHKKFYKHIKNAGALKEHMEKYHPNGQDDGARVNEETNYYDCEKCGASYWDIYTFRRHSCDKGCKQLRCLDCMIPCSNNEALAKHKETKCRKLNPFLNFARR